MKKKPIYLYVLLTLSVISTVFATVTKFLSTKPTTLTAQLAEALKLQTEQAKTAYQTYLDKLFDLSHGLPANLFFYLNILTIIACIFFLVKKDLLKANITYIVNVLLYFISIIFYFVSGRPLLMELSEKKVDVTFIESTNNYSLIIAIVYTVICLSILLFKLWKQQSATTEEISK